MWNVSFRSRVATLRTAIHLLLTLVVKVENLRRGNDILQRGRPVAMRANSERILKIGLYLVELWARVWRLVF